MKYLTKSPNTARILTLLSVGAAAIMAALWLRYLQMDAQQAVTQVLGAKGRAVLEHGLSAVGLPLLLHMMLLVAVPSPANPGLRYAGPVWLAENILLRHMCQRLWAALLGVSSVLNRYCGAIISVVYCAYALRWEHYQAYVSVYGGPPRGYLQYDQLLADVIGAAFAVWVAKWVATNDERAFYRRQD